MIINNNSNHYLSLNIRHHVKYLTYIASLIPTEGLLRFWKNKSHYFYAHFSRTKKHLKKKKKKRVWTWLFLKQDDWCTCISSRKLYVFVCFFFWSGMWDLSSLTKDQTYAPYSGSTENPNHCTAKEIPILVIFQPTSGKWQQWWAQELGVDTKCVRILSVSSVYLECIVLSKYQVIFHTYNTIPDSDVNLCSTPEGSLCLLPIGNSMYNNHYFNLHVYKDLLDSFYRIRTIQNVLFSICLLSLIIYRTWVQ